jgi:L-fuconolactonase
MIDSHLHIWSDDEVAFPWKPIHGATAPTVPGSVEFVLGVLERHGVDAAVAVQPRAYGDDHSYLLHARERHGERIIAVGALSPGQPDAVTSLSTLAAAGFRGLRLDVAGWTEPWLSDGTVLPLWDEAASHGLAIELMIVPDQLPLLAPLAQRSAQTPVVVEHLARYGARETDTMDSLLALAALPNVYAKLSALDSISREPPPHRDLWPLIETAVDVFGADRLMWGSDMPWIGERGYAPALGVIDALQFLTEGERQALLGDTARTVFRVDV